MQLSRTVIHVWREGHRPALPADIRAGVSLHSHSNVSKEKLTFVPEMARRIPVVAGLFDRSLATYERLHGRPFDFSTAYWRPPLAPGAVIASEREQIEECFDRPALVSLTDHDTLGGVTSVRASGQRDVPFSVEWTVPFEDTVFHLGVHGMPPSGVEELQRELAAHTEGHGRSLGELLDWLHASPSTCVVLNHPYWDLAGLGGLRHERTLLAFLRTHRDRIHALELNGYRTWQENRRALPLAEGFNLPLVGGGDRHALAPNTMLNLTRATCFAEFVCELRGGHRTELVVLPQYLAPFTSRVLEGAASVIRHRTGDGGDEGWSARVFVMTPSGAEVPVAALWRRAPWWISASLAGTRLLGCHQLRRCFELSRADGCHTLQADCQPAVAHRRLDMPRPVAVA